MKLKLVITILIHTIYTSTFAQDKIINYDFSNNIFERGTDFDIKDGSTVQIKIFNVNRFLFEVKVTASKINFSSSTPSSKFGELTKGLTANTSDDDNAEANALDTSQADSPNNQNKIDELSALISDLNKIVITYNSLIDISKLNNSFSKIDSLKQDLIENNLQIKSNIDEIITHCNLKFSNTSAIIREISNLNLSESEKKEFDKLKAEFEKAKFNETITNFQNLFNDINETNYTFVSDLVQADFENSDEIKFNIDIKSKETGSSNIRNFDFNVSLVRGWKLDFSAGIFGTDVYNYTYTAKKDSIRVDTNYQKGYRIKRNNTGQFNIGVNTLVHYSYKWKEISAGFNLGIGLMGDPQTIRYLAGLSFIAGSLKRIILNFGACFGSVSRLNVKYKEDEFEQGDLPTSIETTSESLVGWYVGLSWNF